ncbi:MAG: endonuclease MutS2 [Armatimonadota bacterium]
MMEGHTLKVLEYDKVVNALAEHTACSLGRERALALVPQTDVDWIERMQSETSEARGILLSNGSIPLGGITDIRPSIYKAELGSMLTPVELLSVAHTLGSGRRLRGFLVKRKDEFPLLGEIASRMSTFDDIERNVAQSINQGGEILDSASPALARVRSDIKSKHSKIMERLNSIVQSAQYKTALQDPVITQRSERYCVPVKIEYRAQVKGIVHDSSTSGATVFVEPEQIVELGNDLKHLASKEYEEVEKVLIKLSREVAASAQNALSTLEVIGHLDFVTAKAKLSLAMNATEPILNKNGWMRLVQARHPLLHGDVVPIDIELGRRFKALLITGPNTGGKTVTLKTVGLLTLMAQSGMHVSAGVGTEAAVFDQVFADIGDEQSIEQSLSTFSAHVRNIVDVVRGIRPNSLVLFDELGAGTDPAEGAALAKAILEHLLDKGTRMIATTHYGELKEFAFAREGIQNSSVEFDPETLRPTYRLMMGVPGSSNAFAIASRLGMPDDIIKQAEDALSGRENGTDEIIRRIEENQRAAMEDRHQAKKSYNEAESLRLRYEEEIRKLQAARARAEDEVRIQGKQVIERYTKKLEKSLSELSKISREGSRSEQIKKDARESIEKVRDELIIQPEPEEDLPVEGVVFKKGDNVRIANLNQEGVLVDDIRDGEALVMIGVMRVNVPEASLRPSRGSKKEEHAPEPTGMSVTLTKAANISGEINLIGQRAEQALYKLEKYLDEAQGAGLSQVRIIHGKGTGALKLAVWQFLKGHPAVESYRLGEQAEGGAGATIVALI